MANDNGAVKCKECENEVALHLRFCHICEEPIGFPNVRQAEAESSELLDRYKAALQSAEARNASDAVSSFEDAIDNSKVVIARPLADVIALIGEDNKMLQTFANQVAGNARVAENNMWDTTRASVEAAIHPNYDKNIHYAALSLNEYGVKSGYGNCHIKLKTEYITKRTSFFEENPYLFFNKQKHTTGDPVPKGYRSDWQNRSKLAVSKLHSKISDKIEPSEYENILISDEGKDSDFIEAHIYGSLHAKSFESISFVNLNGREKALIAAYVKKLNENNIEYKLD